jgi:hypothetical protein
MCPPWGFTQNWEAIKAHSTAGVSVVKHLLAMSDPQIAAVSQIDNLAAAT